MKEYKKILIEVEVPAVSFEAFSPDDIAAAFFSGFRFGDDDRVRYRIIESNDQKDADSATANARVKGLAPTGDNPA